MYGPVIATLCCMLFCLTGALFVLFSCVYTYALMHTLLFVFDCCFVLLCVIVVFMFYPKQCLQLGWCWYDCVLWSRCCIVCWFGLVWFLVPKSCGTIMVHQIPFNKWGPIPKHCCYRVMYVYAYVWVLVVAWCVGLVWAWVPKSCATILVHQIPL